MPLFLEDKEKVQKKKIQIPQNAKKVFKAMEKVYEPYLDKVQGGHVLKHLARTTDDPGKDTVTVNNAKVIMHRQGQFSPNTVQYQLYGGELGRNIFKAGIAKERRVDTVDAVKPPKPTSDAQLKPSTIKTKDVNVPGGKISYVTSEGRVVSESSDWHVMYDYLSEYGVWYVLDQFFDNPKGKQDWGVLINPDMYRKALTEFTRYGRLVNFPGKYVYQWMGIIMRNTAALEACTELAGHTEAFPADEVSEYAEEKGYDVGVSFEEGSEWLDEIGFYDWNVMPDGSDAISDFGLAPLMKIIGEYDESLPAEKVLVLVNRALDVAHMRGDLSSIFITGGRGTLSRISEEFKRNVGRKVYITEEQLVKIGKCQRF